MPGFGGIRSGDFQQTKKPREAIMRTVAITAFACVLAWPNGATAQISNEKVKIGVLTESSGVYADLAGTGSILAAQMAVEDFGGKVNGKAIEVISANHQNKPDIAASIAKQWLDVEGVDVVVDLPQSGVALAVSEIAKTRKKPALVVNPGSSDLTGPKCSPYTIHWTYDTWALAHGTAQAVVKEGGDSWFFITADYAFGQAMERDASAVVTASGGRLLGSVRHPLDTPDMSSFLLQAQNSKAKVIGLANAGADFVTTVKQAREFNIGQGAQRLAGLLVFLSDVHSLGLEAAQGIQLTTAFYWDHDEETRAWTKRYAARNNGKHPNMTHAGVYSSVLHYLKAVAAAGSDDGTAVVAKMKEMPTDDPLFKKGTIRVDGRKVHPMFLYEVKKPSESKGPYDYYKLIDTIPAEAAFRPIADGKCPYAN
jgi:branched-chain amino acid transport system substrate-binding protein